jgi:aminoglycoside phosphotransferase (APT) family kinase protein
VTHEQHLLAALRAHLQRSDLLFRESPQPLTGGYSNEILRFSLDGAPPPFDRPLVVRITHEEGDTAREAIIEDGVANEGFPAPPVLLRGDASSPFGTPFLITPLSPGVPFDDSITARTAIASFRRLPEQVAATMAALHEVPTGSIAARLAANGWPSERLDSLATLADVDGWAEQLRSPDLERHATLLRARQPSFEASVVCHGDLHPFNLLYEGGQVATVLDWELARLADPAYDVGRTLVLLRQAPYPMPRVLRAAIQPVATWLARRFEDAYRARHPLHEHALRWHEALHCLRTLAIAEVGASLPAGDRMRRTAEVWLARRPHLQRRLTQITSGW